MGSMESNERNILAVTSFGHFMSHFNMLVFPALVLPMTAYYDLHLSEVLALSFWMYLLFGITALPWGLAGDVLGARPLLFLFHAGAGLCGLAAAHFLYSPVLLSLSLAGIGLFSGIYHPAGLGLISRGMTRMSMAMGYNGMAGNAGLAAAPLFAGLMNHLYGMRSAYVVLGLLNLFGAVLMLILPCREPVNRKKAHGHSTGRLLAGFAVLCVAMMLGGIAYRGASVILPAYFELRTESLFQALGGADWLPSIRNVAATALTSLVFIVGMVGQYLGGRAAERFEPRVAYLAFHALALPLVLAMAFATGAPLVLVTMGYMLFLLGMQPVENTLVAVLTPDTLRHSAYGLKFVFTFGVGSLAVRMVGSIEEAWSLPAVFIAMGGVSLAIVATIVILRSVTQSIRF